MKNIDPQIPLKEAIEKSGSQASLARLLEINRVNITDWKNADLEFLPPLHAYRFERLTDLCIKNNNQHKGIIK
jgi:hypothetical protein